VHAPSQNISIARNAGLNACKTRWLAFLDDDEFASVNWLARLMSLREHASAVFGPSEAVYSPKSPKWIRQADLHSNRLIWRHGVVETGYTSNVLMDMDFVHTHKLRFNEELGRSGGEDTMFFAAMRQSGGRLAYASEAIAYECVADARTTLNWVVKRRFRVGQVTAMMRHVYDPREYQLLPLLAPFKICACVAAAVLLAPRRGRAMWWLMRAVFHCGSLSYRLTGRVRQEYSLSEPRIN
jgi:succinoglycan biosynthesis protein ExoM